VAASVITDFEILNMCTFKKDKHYFWKLVPKEVKWVNESMSP
jgi:ribosomal protein L24E